MSVLKEIISSDLALDFTAHPVTGNLTVLTNVAAIKQSVKNLIFTNLSERPFHPDIGSDVLRHLFENFSPITASNMRATIKRVLKNYEPRVTVIDVRIRAAPEDMDNNRIGVTIIFRMHNLTTPVSVDFFLQRLR